MKRDKKITAYAKELIKISSENGQFSEERATAVLQSLEKNQPRNYGPVLKEFLKLAKAEIAKGTAAVEFAGELDSAAIESVRSQFSERYGRPITVTTERNDSLIAGIRVRVGCDVFETSVAAALAELESSLS